MSLTVEHVPSENRFYIRLEDEHAFLDYAPRAGTLSIFQIYVPTKREGEGFAEELTKAAFRYCQKTDRDIVAECPYVKETFLSDHPEWSERVIEDPGPPAGAEFLEL